MIVGAVILCVAALWLGLCYYCFQYALGRKDKTVDIDSRSVVLGPLRDYRPQLAAGRRWIEAQERECVSITSDDGLKLYARLLSQERAKGTILLFHGYHSSGEFDFSGAAKTYYDWGYNLLFADQRAHGMSEGKYIGYGVLERKDCVLWSRYIAGRFGEEHVQFLGGMSMGSTTVQMACGEKLPQGVRGVIADCGFTSPWDIICSVVRADYHLPPAPIAYGMNFFARLLTGYDLRSYSTVEAVEHTKIPILFLHGTSDTFVPCSMTQQSYDACTSEKELVLVEGAEHGMSYLVDPERCLKTLKGFLDQYGGFSPAEIEKRT